MNLIEAGQNYGWPQAQGSNHPLPFRTPLALYQTAIAPAGMTFYDGNEIPQWRGSLFFATLQGRDVRRLTLDPADLGRVASEERLYAGEFGRLRDVVQGPDGELYITTSNQDGRGDPAANDDRVIRITTAH